MNADYDDMTVVELRALVRECGLQGYSRLRKAGLIAFLWDNIQPRPMSASSQLVRL